MKFGAIPTSLSTPFSIAISLALGLVFLSACTGVNPVIQPDEAAPATPGVTASPAASRPTPTHTPEPTQPVRRIDLEPSQLEGVTIQFWYPWEGETREELEQLVSEFNSTNELGIEVEAVSLSTFDQLAVQVETSLAAGEGPDLAAAYQYQAQSWEDQYNLVDLAPYVEDSVWGLTPEEQADFYPAFWESGLQDDKRLGIPILRSAQMLYYNISWARSLGFDQPPTTPKEFRDQVCAAAQANNADDTKDNDGTGGWIISTHYASILSWMESFGAQTSGSNGESYHYDSDATHETFTFLRELLDSRCAWLGQDLTPDTEFATRRGLIAVESIAAVPDFKTTMSRQKNRDEWTLIPYPSPTGQPVLTGYGPSLSVLPSTPERQLAAWLFARWLVSPEVQARLVEASGSLPVRSSALPLLEAYSSQYPQWGTAAELLPNLQPEPNNRSWQTVRWAVNDAATQLFRYYFTIDQVPSLVKLLDATAADLNGENPPAEP